MELFTNVINNDYSIIQYTDVNKHSKLKLKYPLFKNDSIYDLRQKITISLDESEYTDSNNIFIFIQKQNITENQIIDLEKKVIPNETLRLLIKNELGNILISNKNELKEFCSKK